MPATLRDYEWFHANPEPSGEEQQTAARLAERLRELGLVVHTGVGGHGVIGVLSGATAGKVVMYRADLDALRVTEATGLPYRSKKPGVMHACGHDLHVATALGAVRVLAATRATWSGTVIVVGQPAEETGKGSQAVLSDPVFQRVLAQTGKPSVVLALHDVAELPAGQVGMIAGFSHASADAVDIIVHGKGGHGARPHTTIDPIVIGAELVMSLQSIVARRIEPGEEAVVTVGKFAAGTDSNVIANDATLLLTVRSYAETTRAKLLEEIKRTATHVARAHGAVTDPTLTVHDHIPASFCDPAWTARLERVFQRTLGDANVSRVAPTMGSEDFSRYAKELGVPAVMWKLGAVPPAEMAKPDRARPHSDRWAPDARPALRTGIATAVAAILEGLR